jgi:CheY-like chemotaxis protein
MDFQIVVKEVLKLMRASLPATIEIRQKLWDAPCYIKADSSHIYQIIINLCTNAAYAMKGGGGVLDVAVSVDHIKSNGDFLIPDLTPGEYVKLSVRDTGCGISASIANSIFDPFFTTKPQSEGTGMGLSVVYGIVHSHGGNITLKSELDKGSTFSVYLPLIAEERAIKSREERNPSLTGKGSILLIDDEPAIVLAMQEQLVSLGYKVRATTSSQEGLELFRKNPNLFDLIITDMTMPQITGYQLASEVIKIKSDFPIVLCTGYSEVISEEERSRIGIRHVAMKPLRKVELARIVKENITPRQIGFLSI